MLSFQFSQPILDGDPLRLEGLEGDGELSFFDGDPPRVEGRLEGGGEPFFLEGEPYLLAGEPATPPGLVLVEKRGRSSSSDISNILLMSMVVRLAAKMRDDALPVRVLSRAHSLDRRSRYVYARPKPHKSARTPPTTLIMTTT